MISPLFQGYASRVTRYLGDNAPEWPLFIEFTRNSVWRRGMLIANHGRLFDAKQDTELFERASWTMPHSGRGIATPLDHCKLVPISLIMPLATVAEAILSSLAIIIYISSRSF